MHKQSRQWLGGFRRRRIATAARRWSPIGERAVERGIGAAFGREVKRALAGAAISAWFILNGGSMLVADSFSVATYNLDNYLDTTGQNRSVKSAASRAKIRESIRAINPDLLALQEVGSLEALGELRASLKSEGLDYPFWEWVSGFDTNIHVVVLSRYPIAACRPHTNENYLLGGRRFHVSRGFAEVDIRIPPRYAITLLAAHLKSRRVVPEADEAAMREQEALLLREIVDARLRANPNVNLIVLGDFNDSPAAKSTRTIKGHGKTALVDTRPAERNGDDQANPIPYLPPRNVTWTHYFGKEDTYSRIDYIMVSLGMMREWSRKDSYVLAQPNWGIGSDHRPIVARFLAEDR